MDEKQLKEVKKKSILPYIISSVISVAYVSPFEAKGEFSTLAALLKTGPILYLILYINTYIDSTSAIFLDNKNTKEGKYWKERRHLATGILCGLVCSVLGDFILLGREHSELFFLVGTGAFGLAQLSYINAIGFHYTRIPMGFGLYLVAATASYFILKKASWLVQMVLSGYGTLLVTSLWRAIDRSRFEDDRSYFQKKFLILGFSFFLASDFWIGISTFLFRSHPIASMQFILSTYYAAQGLIVLAVC